MSCERGEMFKGSIILGVFCIVMILSSAGIVSSEKLISDNNVKYDSKILDMFKNNTFVDVIIYLKDLSEADDLVSGFSEDELKDVINRQIPNRSSERIGAKISEEGFYKLIQDDRVEKVYYNLPVYGTGKSTLKLSLLIGMGIVLIIIILYLIIKKRKKE